MNTKLCLKLNIDFEFQIAIAWNAIKHFLYSAYNFAEGAIS